MSSVNKVLLVGHIGKEPYIRSLANHSKVLSFPLATTESIRTGNQPKEVTEWHNVIMWNELAEAAHHLLCKGLLVYVEGQVKTRSFVDSAGIKKYSTEVVALGFKLLV